jgi:phosphatidylserine/phosphatidylglycerophosphate/cardiolipin synthase-like enzyme
MTKRRTLSKKNAQNQLIIGIAAIILIACLAGLRLLGFDVLGGEPAADDTTPSDGNVVTEPADDEGAAGGTADWYQIYFTSADCPPEEERVGGIDETIAADLLQAQNTVDVAAYDFEAQPIIDALIELHGRGVQVRVVTDTDNADLPTIAELRDNDIEVVEDDRSGIMHEKFIVIDGRYLWVGAMNFAGRDVYCHNNNTVRFDAPQLAANYTAEMEEMFVDGSFGPTSPDNTPNPQLTINGVEIENYFASEGDVASILAERVAAAQNEILFLAFSFTHEDIGETMLARAEEGVTVRGVFETTGSDTQYSYFGPMRDAGLDNLQVRQDGNGFLMHHKVIILDQSTTIFGSFNFSGNANESNDENVLIVHDPTFTSFFIEEFNTVWDEAKQE